jgi:CRISPR/Cas system CSM-associated protein Csm3 (group 7 of RAMP superfamily)
MFGSGFGDDDADQTQVKEKTIVWSEGRGSFSDAQILMPASSVKGALVHRTAFYYNKMQMQESNDYTPMVAEKNAAVKALFGEAKESDDKLGSKGKVLFSDLYKDERGQEKVFDHVSIDRFTGGAIEGALFQEKTVAQKDMWEMKIVLENSTVESAYVEAFEQALCDIATGMLALGGTTNKGHGVFSGEVLKNGERL